MINRMRPLPVRRAALKGFAEGRTLRDIAAECKVSAPAVQKWAKEAGVQKGAPLTDEELDAIIERWSENHRNMEIRGEATERKKAHKESKMRQKFGLSKDDKAKSVASFKDLGDIDEFRSKIKEQADLNQVMMSGAMSPQEQAKGMMLGILYPQLHELIGNLPPITNWADVERFMKLVRLTLGMDREDVKEGVGADLKILNAKVERDKIIEINPETGKPIKRRKNAS